MVLSGLFTRISCVTQIAAPYSQAWAPPVSMWPLWQVNRSKLEPGASICRPRIEATRTEKQSSSGCGRLSVSVQNELALFQAEPTAEANRGRHSGFSSFNVFAGGLGSLALAFVRPQPSLAAGYFAVE